MNYVNTHLHTHHSPQDGTAKSEEYAARAVELGMSALAITDHGRISGWREHQRACEKYNIKPILGEEMYWAPAGVEDRTSRAKLSDGQDFYNHLIVLAKNANGQRNLQALSKESWSERAFYAQPRIDREMLSRYGEDLIITSGCMSGIISKHITRGDMDKAMSAAAWFKDMYGGDFYVELQTENPAELNHGLLLVADTLGIKPITSDDCHMVSEDDKWLEEAFLILANKPKRKQGIDIDAAHKKSFIEMFDDLYGDDRGMRFVDMDLFLASKDFRKAKYQLQGIDRDDLFENTLEIADKIGDYSYYKGLNLLPKPKADDPMKRFETICHQGMRARGLSGKKEYEDRLDFELEVIRNKDLGSYFLILSNTLKWGKSKGILFGPARGSAGASLACWVSGITEIDPIFWNLPFARFLDPEREDEADVDIDIPDDRRQEVLDYMQKQYGHVANISTFNFFKEKNSLKDAAAVMLVPFAESNRIIKDLPDDNTFDVYEKSDFTKEFRTKYPKVIQLARRFNGRIRGFGQHAAGMVVSSEPIENYVPMETRKPGDVRFSVLAYDMAEISEIGLVKIDWLSLKMLKVLDNTRKLVKERHGKEIDYYNMTLDDPAVFKMLADGYTSGIFQAEKAAFTKTAIDLQINSFDDIAATTALIRPGAMNAFGSDYIAVKRGEAPRKTIHPLYDKVTEDTYSYPLYQESWMNLCVELAGLSVGESNAIRKVTAKKKDPHLLDKYHDAFVDGCLEHIDRSTAEALWADLLKTSEYQFNKAHSVAYSMITYWTAWCKIHYPLEYMYCLISTETDNDSVTDYLIEAKRLGIKIRLPHVNSSDVSMSIEDGAIRFGLSNIKYISEKTAPLIIAGRPFENYKQFSDHVKTTKGLNVRTLTAVNAIGAAKFDDNPLHGDERSYYYEYLGLPELDTGSLPPKVTQQFTTAADYNEGEPAIISGLVRAVVRKNGWCRIDTLQKDGTISFFTDPSTPIASGDKYLMLLANKGLQHYINMADVKVNNPDPLVQWLRFQAPVCDDGQAYILSFKSKKTKRGDRMGVLTYGLKDKSILSCLVWPKSYMLALGKCKPGTLVKLETDLTEDGARFLVNAGPA